jgi:DNA-binding NtrC family response regulator
MSGGERSAKPIAHFPTEPPSSVVRVRSAAPVEDAVLGLGAVRGRSPVMRDLFAVIERASRSRANVLVTGESGTGKELVARELVKRGARADKPFVVIDCGALSPTLAESELFGHLRGAFTGAERDRIGAFEAADGGTIFLDEIGDLPIDLQPKLLRVLETREIRRVGETKLRRIDTRVIAATHRRLRHDVACGRFREDLFYRLSVVTLHVPPLRDRNGDMLLLVEAVLESLGASDQRHLFDADVLAKLLRHTWPGNVRELRNYVERTIVHGRAEALPLAEPVESAPSENVDIAMPFKEAKRALVERFSRQYLEKLVEWSGGNVSRAARRAGMNRMNLHRLLREYRIAAGRDETPLD